MLLLGVSGKVKVDTERTRFSVSQGDATLGSPFHSSFVLVCVFVGPNESCNSCFKDTVFLQVCSPRLPQLAATLLRHLIDQGIKT